MSKRLLLLFVALFLSSVQSVRASVVDQAQSRFASFEKTRVHYLDTGGEGDIALILVHCWTCNANFWKESINAFPKLRVIAVDLPGHGLSDKPMTNYTMEYFARSIHAVMKNAGIKRAVLVGHSIGTPVIRQFYRIYPKKTLALVVVDGPLRPFGKKEEMEKFFAPLKTDYKQAAPRFMEGMFGPQMPPAMREEIKTSTLNTPDYVAISAIENMIDEKIWKEDKINVPVLAVMAKSPFVPADIEQRYRSIAPNLEFHMWDGVDHFLMMEKPDEFNKVLMAFLVKNKFVK